MKKINFNKELKEVTKYVSRIYFRIEPDHHYAVANYSVRMDNKHDNNLVFETESFVVLELRREWDGDFWHKDSVCDDFLIQVTEFFQGCVNDSGIDVSDWKKPRIVPSKYEFFSSQTDVESHIDEMTNGYKQRLDDWHKQNPNAPHPFKNGQVRTH